MTPARPARLNRTTRQFKEFSARAGAARIHFGYSTRAAGFPGFYSVLEKRGAIAVPDQTHSDRIVRPHRAKRAGGSSNPAITPDSWTRAGGRARIDIPDCDALVTPDTRQILTVRTADCLPIFFWEKSGKVVAIAHAGWKGTHRKIAVKTVARLKRLGAALKNIRVVLGPAIRACCYEVGTEFADRFDARTLRRNPAGRFQFDLALANRLQLTAAGIPPQNIRDLKLCTACDTRTFFSFRRDPSDPGRMIHWIVKD